MPDTGSSWREEGSAAKTKTKIGITLTAALSPEQDLWPLRHHLHRRRHPFPVPGGRHCHQPDLQPENQRWPDDDGGKYEYLPVGDDLLIVDEGGDDDVSAQIAQNGENAAQAYRKDRRAADDLFAPKGLMCPRSDSSPSAPLPRTYGASAWDAQNEKAEDRTVPCPSGPPGWHRRPFPLTAGRSGRAGRDRKRAR